MARTKKKEIKFKKVHPADVVEYSKNNPGASKAEMAEYFEVNVQTIYKVVNAIKADKNLLKQFREHKTDILDNTAATLIGSIVNHDMESASLRDKASALKVIDDISYRESKSSNATLGIEAFLDAVKDVHSVEFQREIITVNLKDDSDELDTIDI